MTNKEAIEILDALRFTDDALRKAFYKVDKAIDLAIKALQLNDTYKNAYRIMSDAFENEVRKNIDLKTGDRS